MHAAPFALLLVASLSLAAPATAQRAAAASPAAQPSVWTTPHDRASNLVGGVWQCETIAGSLGTHTYSLNDGDGSIDLQTELREGHRTFKIAENYHFDAERNRWYARTEGDAYDGNAAPWTGYKWIFDGTGPVQGRRIAIRMVYFDLANSAFRRDFQSKQDGAWRTYSAETCKRPSN